MSQITGHIHGHRKHNTYIHIHRHGTDLTLNTYHNPNKNIKTPAPTLTITPLIINKQKHNNPQSVSDRLIAKTIAWQTMKITMSNKSNCTYLKLLTYTLYLHTTIPDMHNLEKFFVNKFYKSNLHIEKFVDNDRYINPVPNFLKIPDIKNRMAIN